MLFGGTFDPVHVAHIRCARAVSQVLGGAPVHMMPNAVPPHRPQPGASEHHRMAMLELVCAPHPALIVDDSELRRGGHSYTVDSLRARRADIGRQRPLVFLVGGDSFADLHHWHRWQDFAELCHLAVVPRPGAPEPANEVSERFLITRRAEELMNTPCGRALLLGEPQLDISATAIRSALARQGYSDELEPAVMAYIRAHRLYRCCDGASESR